MLDALCWLEQRGKSMVVGAYSSTAQEPPRRSPRRKSRRRRGAFERGFKALWEGIIALIRRGNRNHLIMQDKQGKQAISLPVTIFVVLLIAAFWVVLPLMVVALFFGCRFSFSGPELGREDLNSAMGKATDFADDIKKEFQ